MSGPYNQQQVLNGSGFGQGVGYANGVNVAQAGGQTITQTSSSQRVAESHQVQQNAAGGLTEQQQRQERELSQATTGQRQERETLSQATSTQRSVEAQQTRQGSSGSGYRHHRQRDRDNSHSSSGSSAGAYRVTGAEGAAAAGGSYQQYSAENSHAYGAATGGPYGVTSALGGAYAAGGNPCGSAPVEGPRRPGRHQKQVIRLPDQPQGPTRQVRRRLPTPEPDTLERVYIQRVAGEVVEEITEIPTTPPPIVQERTVCEPAGPPKVVKRVIRVPPRGNNCQQAGGFVGNAGQSANLLSASSYGSVQQASGSFQQLDTSSPLPTGASVSLGSGAGNHVVGAVGGFSPAGASFSSVGPAYGAQGAGFSTSGAAYGAQGAGFSSAGPAYGVQGGGFPAGGSAYGAQGGGFPAGGSAYGAQGVGFQQQAASFGSSYQQQAASFSGAASHASSPYGAGFSFIAQGLTPSAGLQQATCFYV
ncbi:unnamed protein product [Adineta ricciae]|uniref:Uncharacterized protein n=1 Tax=Adineta ricciae TaxID=249248 RepID=A0A813MHK8_ADIRI|nr:unnamed protein product [Adineta ricciae]CAF1606965.1 unnamed protein product [Adineta ricciae]